MSEEEQNEHDRNALATLTWLVVALVIGLSSARWYGDHEKFFQQAGISALAKFVIFVLATSSTLSLFHRIAQLFTYLDLSRSNLKLSKRQWVGKYKKSWQVSSLVNAHKRKLLINNP